MTSQLPLKSINEKEIKKPIQVEEVERKSDLKPSSKIEEDVDFSKYIDRVEEDWNKSVEDLFLEEAESAKRNISEYKKLKNGYEAEREKRYEEFHRIMEEKHGPSYSYSPSVDEEMFNEKLVKAYEKSLSKIIGTDKMRKYVKMKDDFNRKLEEESKKSKNNESFLLIEF